MQKLLPRIEERISAVAKLALEGVAGEKKAAQDLLLVLCDKYDLIVNDFLDTSEPKKWVNFYYKRYDHIGGDLLIQVILSVISDQRQLKRNANANVKPFKRVEVTATEELEIRARYEFYRARLEEGIEEYLIAFFIKNNLKPQFEYEYETEEPKRIGEESEEDKKARLEAKRRARRIAELSTGMDRQQYRKTLKS